MRENEMRGSVSNDASAMGREGRYLSTGKFNPGALLRVGGRYTAVLPVVEFNIASRAHVEVILFGFSLL